MDPDHLEQDKEIDERYADILSRRLKEIFHVVIINPAPSPLLCSIFSEGRKLFCKDLDLLTDLIEQVSLDMLATENVAWQGLEEIVP